MKNAYNRTFTAAAIAVLADFMKIKGTKATRNLQSLEHHVFACLVSKLMIRNRIQKNTNDNVIHEKQ